MRKSLSLLPLLLLFTACGIHKPQPQPVIIQHDTVIRERIIRDTARIEVPVIKEKIVTLDTASHLENDWAKSDAAVSDGLLSHSLETKPKVIEVPIYVPVRDTIIKEGETHAEIVEVEKPLSWWESLRMGAFWWLAGAVVVLIGILTIKFK